MPLRPVLRDLARCLLAAVAMGLVMAAFGTRHLDWWEIVVGGPAGVAVYIGALLALKAVTVDELRAFRGAVAGKFRRRRPAAAAQAG
jgi:threonine aldolase